MRDRVADPPRERFHPRDAIRLGLKIHPLTDLYYQLMRRSWWVLISALVGFFLLANLAFAALYMADMPGISSAESGGFAQAFEFSVQTISTIGYGGMSPQTPYVHTLVTAEAMVGVLGFAIATGLMFQKFSRPKAMVLFSEPLVLTVREGKPVLMLRLGNARGNEIIEASLRVTMLKPEVTAEGHRMRRLYDLDLMRTHTPMFVMTWVVVHEIDENSPMFGETADKLEAEDAIFIVTMTGIDATFSETVYARKIYYSEAIRWGERFEDVVSFTDEGQAVIDYNRFDATVADPADLDVRAMVAPQNTA
ncbi:MAG: ion channel [Myxococcota bacterium]